MMMALGLFVFSLRTAAYQELQRVTNWRHPSNSRVGSTPAYQFTGKGEDTITLKGEIYHELTYNRVVLDQVRRMADTGMAYIWKQMPPTLNDQKEPVYIQPGQLLDLWLSVEMKTPIDSL
jgi:phage protein U